MKDRLKRKAPLKEPTKPKLQYPQRWREYNEAARKEPEHFRHLLYELCRNIEEPYQPGGRGRPPLPLADIIFGGALRVYMKSSVRQFASQIKQACERGYISMQLHPNSISRYLEQKNVTPHLHHLIERSSLPLQQLETTAAIDATGFSTNRFDRWLNARVSGRKREKYRQWLKLHTMIGVRTNTIICAEVSEGYIHDYHFFKPLLERACANGYEFEAVCADKGYIGLVNLEAALAAGMRPLIPFKSNAVSGANKSGLWNSLLYEYRHRREEFDRHYHQRSNVESTFSGIKRRFNERLRSKTKVSQTNEVLLKALCWNLVVLVQSMREFDLDAESILRVKSAPVAKIVPFPYF